jgi:hypothetical protein
VTRYLVVREIRVKAIVGRISQGWAALEVLGVPPCFAVAVAT